MFDGVHLGHRHLLHRLAELNGTGGTPPLAFTFVDHPATLIAPDRAPLLLSTAGEKQRLIASEGVTPVMLHFDRRLQAMTVREFLTMLRDRYGIGGLLVGFNNRIGSDRDTLPSDYPAIGRDVGVEVVQAEPLTLPDGTVPSSTRIRQLLLEGDVTEAATLSGRGYQLSGTVVKGHQVGRTIGFPTANLTAPDSRKLIPAPGVYACRATTGADSNRTAIVNIGTRPTVDPTDPTHTVEAHIDGLDRDIYGQALELSFVSRLRDTRRFDSLDALRTQLQADLAAARTLTGE